VSIRGVRDALRELRTRGYTCHRVRAVDGFIDSDPYVLVERTA